MLERLGYVLYWGACALTALGLIAAAGFGFMAEGSADRWLALFALVVAVVIWFVGRACRYVLAGR